MTSYAELLQNCAEFQENFATLNGKYNALTQELQNERQTTERWRKKVEESVTVEEQHVERIRALKKDLEESDGYKDRYLAARISVEHLQGRLENARRAAQDTLMEHNQQVEQLKSQQADLLKRIESAGEGSRVMELRKQLTEVEERCAVMSGQLSEQKEVYSVQVLAAHNALREQQSRNLELEQRYRTMEGEVQDMRSALRKAVDMQNEAALIKDRFATEAAVAGKEAERLRKSVKELERQQADVRRDAASELEAVRQEGVEMKAQLEDRLANHTALLREATAATQRERDRFDALQRQMQRQVDAARDESTAELSGLRQTVSSLREDRHRLQWRVQELEEELEKERVNRQQLTSQVESLTAKTQHLQREVDQSVQQESWVSSERRHLSDQLLAAQKQIEELAHTARQQEQTLFEVDRLRLGIKCSGDELADARRHAQDCATRLLDVEEAANLRVRSLRHELHQYKKQAKMEKAKSDSLQRKLIQALAAQEAELNRLELAAPRIHTAAAAAPPLASAALPPVSGCGTNSFDVISMLRAQKEQAEQLHHRLVELSPSAA